MPDWLTVTLYILGAALTFSAFCSLIWRKVIKPLKAGYEKLLRLLEQIRDASSGVQRLAREVEALAGAVVTFVVGIKEQVDRNSIRIDRLEEMQELVVDLQADVERIRQRHRRTDEQ